MDWDELSSSIRSRLSSPIYFPFLLSFLAVNWREIFVLFVPDEGATALDRIVFFDLNTDVYSLLIMPAILAAALLVFTPFLRLAHSWAVQWPIKMRRLTDGRTDTSVMQAKEKASLEHEVDMASYREVISQKDLATSKNVDEIGDDDLRESAKATIIETSQTTESKLNWLREHSTDLQTAKGFAFNESKLVLAIIYDGDERRLKEAVGYFFEYKETQEAALKHLKLVLVSTSESPNISDEFRNHNKDLSLERPAYILYDFDGKVIETGRLHANPDTGFDMVRAWINKYQG